MSMLDTKNKETDISRIWFSYYVQVHVFITNRHENINL